jgi:hypothetical protein
MRIVPGASASATTFDIDGQHAQGEAPALWHRNSAVVTYGGATMPINNVPPLSVGPVRTFQGGKLFSAGAIASPTVGFVDVGVLALDPEKAYGRDVMAGTRRGLTAGSIPMVWGNGDLAHEVSPLVSCPFFTISGGATATFNVIAVVYVIISPDGTVWRSAPLVLQTAINATADIKIPTIPIKTASAELQVEIYLGTTAPLLQTVIPFSETTVDSTFTWTLPASAGALINGEVLYTWGGELSQSPPISAEAVGYWKNRVLLANGRTVYASSEHSDGIGPYFNEQQGSFWGEAPGSITGMAQIDSNYCAVFADGGIAALSGAGPDRRGSGNFSIVSVSARTGLRFGYRCLQGPAGCYYPDGATQRLRVVTTSLQDVDCGGGAWDYAGAGTYAAWYDKEKLMLFSYSDGFIVIDYQHPTEAAPYGQVYHWSTSNFVCGIDVDSNDAIGHSQLVCVLSDGSISRIYDGQSYDTTILGTSTYKMKLASAELQPSGMQGEFSLSTIQALVSVMAACGFTLTIYPAFASRIRSPAASNVSVKTVTFATPDMPGDPQKVMHRPAYCGRIESFGFSIEEAAGVANAAFQFEGFAIEYVPHGKLVYPASGKVI